MTLKPEETCGRQTQGDFNYRHHNEPRVQLYVPKEETFPVPLKYIDVTRSTHTNLHVMHENALNMGTSTRTEVFQLLGQDSQISNCC